MHACTHLPEHSARPGGPYRCAHDEEPKLAVSFQVCPPHLAPLHATPRHSSLYPRHCTTAVGCWGSSIRVSRGCSRVFSGFEVRPRRGAQVLVGAHALLANGGVMTGVGCHLTALAAKRHAVPFVVLVGLHKLSPLFPHDPALTFNDFKVAPSAHACTSYCPCSAWLNPLNNARCCTCRQIGPTHMHAQPVTAVPARPRPHLQRFQGWLPLLPS